MPKSTAIFVVLFTLGAALSAPPIQQIRDSLTWAKEVEQGTNLFAFLHPHHLGYLPAVRALYLGLHEACASCRAIVAAQVLGVVALATAAVALFYLARRLSGSTAIAMCIALILTLSRSAWVFSMQVSPYVPTLAALSLMALAVVTRGERLPHDKVGLMAIAVAYACAVLFHQAAVLVGFALVAYLVASLQPRDAWQALLRLTLLSGGFVLVCYIAAFSAIYGAERLSVQEFTKYITRYASTNTPGFGSLVNLSPSGVEGSFRGLFESFALLPWRAPATPLAGFMAGLVLLLGWHVRRAWLADARAVRAFFIAWLAVILAFQLWEDPVDSVKKTLVLVPVLALLALAVGDILRRASGTRSADSARVAVGVALLAVAATLAIRNFNDAIWPLHASLGRKHEKASLIAEAAPKSCTVLEGDQEVNMNLYYYFDRNVLEVWDLRTWFFFGDRRKVPHTWDGFRFSDHKCFLVEARHLSPAIPVLKLAGDAAPSRWYAYVEWLLGFAYDGGIVSSTRCTRGVRDSTGARYLLIALHDRCDASGLEDVMGRLDSLLGPIENAEGVAVFSDWLDRHRHVVLSFGQRRPGDTLQ